LQALIRFSTIFW